MVENGEQTWGQSYPSRMRAKLISCWNACGLSRKERSCSPSKRVDRSSLLVALASLDARRQAPQLLLKGRTMATPNLAHALVIPDSLLAKEATDILREHSTDLLFNHSIRVYLFATEQGRQRKLRFDPELLYVAAAFHDLGLIK